MNKENAINTAVGCVMASYLKLDTRQKVIDCLRNLEEKPVEINIANNLSGEVHVCVGMEEYEIKPRQEVTVQVKDGDVIYLDTLVP